MFRSNLRRPFGENVEIRFLTEPKEMTRRELLTLEGEKIQEMHEKNQCYLNHDPNPLETWKKYN